MQVFKDGKHFNLSFYNKSKVENNFFELYFYIIIVIIEISEMNVQEGQLSFSSSAGSFIIIFFFNKFVHIYIV